MSQALFPGWRPDAGGRKRLQQVALALAAARPDDAPRLQPRRADQWHATLCFIGYDMRDRVTPALLDAFAEAATRIPPHAFTVERVAYWHQSGAVVALPHPNAELQALCDEAHRTIRRCGIHPLQVTTQPHVTLAYLDKHLPAQTWLDAVECQGAPVRVDGFELLYNPGGRYEALASWPLTGAAIAPPPRQAQLL